MTPASATDVFAPACGHKRPDPDCVGCRRWATDPVYRQHVLRFRANPAPGGPPAGASKAAPPPPCVDYGDTVPAGEVARLGLPTLRDWHYCEEPSKPLGAVVCRCAGCGPTCPKYRPDPAD